MTKLTAAEKKKLVPHLHRTVDAVEQILTGGLTTAGETTHQTFAVTFQEAARLKLLRLAGTLRNTHEEISRFVKDDARFSQTRLMFFLNRSWLLCKGLETSIRDNDRERLAQLLWTPPTEKVDSLRLACLGVVKKIAVGAFCSFEFRMRSVDDGGAWTWSIVFPIKAGVDIPAEGFLHLPQKQKFTANILLQGKVIEIKNAAASEMETHHRLQLLDESTVELGDDVEDWEPFLRWDPARAVRRVRDHDISPFDVDIELQEDVYFDEYALGKPEELEDEQRRRFPLTFREVEFDLTISSSLEGEAATAALKPQLRKDEPDPLFGVMHYAGSRLVVQPLTLFEFGKPKYITISEKSIDRKALLSTLKFT